MPRVAVTQPHLQPRNPTRTIDMMDSRVKPPWFLYADPTTRFGFLRPAGCYSVCTYFSGISLRSIFQRHPSAADRGLALFYVIPAKLFGLKFPFSVAFITYYKIRPYINNMVENTFDIIIKSWRWISLIIIFCCFNRMIFRHQQYAENLSCLITELVARVCSVSLGISFVAKLNFLPTKALYFTQTAANTFLSVSDFVDAAVYLAIIVNCTTYPR